MSSAKTAFMVDISQIGLEVVHGYKISSELIGVDVEIARQCGFFERVSSWVGDGVSPHCEQGGGIDADAGDYGNRNVNTTFVRRVDVKPTAGINNMHCPCDCYHTTDLQRPQSKVSRLVLAPAIQLP